MTPPLTITTERVDDIPLLLAQLKQMQVPELLDKHFPTHGNWGGASLGQVGMIWLTHILSEGDHRLNQVEDWVGVRLTTLRACTFPELRALDLSDDRLAGILDALSDERRWETFEQELTGHLVRTYELEASFSRVDSTSVSGYGSVSPAGLFQFGHSKDHRPDLPQVKIKLSTLDPLGLPLVTTVVAGNKADDPLYVPAIQRVQASLGRRGLTHIGDGKMGALSTRAYVQASGDYYLVPLSQVQMSPHKIEARLADVWTGQQRLTSVYPPPDETTERRPPMAEGFEWRERLTAEVAGETVTWTERRLLVKSFKHAAASETALRTRLAQAQAAVEALNQRGRGRPRFVTVAVAQEAAEQLVQKYQVAGLLHLTYLPQVTRRRVRAYGQRPARTETQRDVRVAVQVNETALQHAIRLMGWRVYVTNQAATHLPLKVAVLAYRHQFLEERCFGRLKGRSLNIAPLYLASEPRVKGLIHLLSIGLRVLTLMEFQVRRSLQAEAVTLAGLYAGQPQRTTVHPTTEQLLRAFTGVTLTALHEGESLRYHLTPLSKLQRRILNLAGFPVNIYSALDKKSAKLTPKMGEP